MIKVPSWRKFQHYKDRSPAWIKLYRSTLNDRHIASLDDFSFRVLIAIWLLASDNDGAVDERDLVFNMRVESKPMLPALETLASRHLIIICEETLALCSQDASEVVDRGEERGEEREERRVDPTQLSTPFPTAAGPVGVDHSTGRLKPMAS